jgi:hypothetical protein
MEEDSARSIRTGIIDPLSGSGPVTFHIIKQQELSVQFVGTQQGTDQQQSNHLFHIAKFKVCQQKLKQSQQI